MYEPDDQQMLATGRWIDDWGSAIAIALAIMICLGAFIWIYVQLDPWMSDFTGSDAVITPATEDVLVTPTDDAGGDAPEAAP